uniref:Variant surface glycoprotein 1125.2747 n=1 Tax=Trypanosoma brucei TaxID=5691 RepID=A0A1J0R8M6_9TRYP|nr:variant surface glycoprotein 1125.2747 [Trypanosoma brucei]
MGAVISSAKVRNAAEKCSNKVAINNLRGGNTRGAAKNSTPKNRNDSSSTGDAEGKGDYLRGGPNKLQPGDEKTLAGDGTYPQACANGKSGKTVANDLLYICLLATASSWDECGTSGVTEGWNNNVLPAIPKLIGRCPQGNAGQLTAEKLHGIVAALSARLRAHKQAANVYRHLGKMSGTGCSGATGQMCATYTGYFSGSDNGGVASIPWVKKLEEAADMIRQSHTAAAEGAALKARLRALRISAWTIYNGNEETKSATTKPAKQATEQLQAAAKECNKQMSNKTVCKSTGYCKWEAKDGKSETDGECEPKDGEGQSNTAAGTEEATGTYACARHGTNEKSCLADKTDGKQS